MPVFSLRNPRKATERKGPLNLLVTTQTLTGRDPNWEGTHERLGMRLRYRGIQSINLFNQRELPLSRQRPTRNTESTQHGRVIQKKNLILPLKIPCRRHARNSACSRTDSEILLGRKRTDWENAVRMRSAQCVVCP